MEEKIELFFINKSLKNYFIDKNGIISFNGNELPYTEIFRKNNNKISFQIEYLLAKCFLENPFNCKIIVYKDNNLNNKKLDNLEWSSVNQESYIFLKENKGKSSGKFCRDCKEYKSYSEYDATKNFNYYYPTCKVCRKKKRDIKAQEYNERRKANRKSKNGLNYLNNALKYEQFKENKKEYLKFLEKTKRYNDNNWWISTLSQLKRRSKDLNLPFNLTKEDLVVPSICPLLEIPISRKNPIKFHCVSWDRIIPELGYIKGNIRAISVKANVMKNNATLKELECFARNIIPYMKNTEFVDLQGNPLQKEEIEIKQSNYTEI